MLHCEAVLKSVLTKIDQGEERNALFYYSFQKKVAQVNLPIKFVAFSKGGLVLNNLLAEVANAIYVQSRILANAYLNSEYLFDWEADFMACQLPAYEPSQRIGINSHLVMRC